MPIGKRIVSLVMLVAGVVLVFAGLSSALGFTPGAMLVSAAAIAALLYAGATWFTTPAVRAGGATAEEPALLVFDRDGRIVSGAAVGQLLTLQFPELLRGEIERRCAGALGGTSGRFLCLLDGRPVVFDALPIRNVDGTIDYAILVRAQATAAPVAASA